MILGIIGNSPDDFSNRDVIQSEIDKTIHGLYAENGDNLFLLVYGNIGACQWVCESAISLKIPYGLYLQYPVDFLSQHWYDNQKELLKAHQQSASSIYVADFNPLSKNKHKVNSSAKYKLVDDSNALVVFWSGKKRGQTYETIQYAIENDKIIYNALRDMKLITKEDLR